MNVLHSFKTKTIHIVGAVILCLTTIMSVGMPVARAAVSTQCAPAAGLGMVTTTNFPVPTAGKYKLWVRMKAASSTLNIVALEAQSGTGALACFPSVGGTGLSTTEWQWKLAGEANLTTTNNTIYVAGKHANVMVDKVIPVSSASTCDPNLNNVRNTTTGVEPGDTCLPTPTPTVTSTPTATVTPTRSITPTPTATATPTPTPTLSITPAPTVVPTATPTPSLPPTPVVSPTGPQQLGIYLYYDWLKGKYYTQLNYSQAGGTVKAYEVQRNGLVIGKTTSAQTSLNDYNLVADTAYTYQVFATNDTQRSAGSPKYTVTVKCFFIFCGLQ